MATPLPVRGFFFVPKMCSAPLRSASARLFALPQRCSVQTG